MNTLLDIPDELVSVAASIVADQLESFNAQKESAGKLTPEEAQEALRLCREKGVRTANYYLQTIYQERRVGLFKPSKAKVYREALRIGLLELQKEQKETSSTKG